MGSPMAATAVLCDKAGGEWSTVDTSWGRKDRVSVRSCCAEVMVV